MGVGETSPATGLHLNKGTQAAQLQIGSATEYLTIGASTGGPTAGLAKYNTVGTSSPSHRFEVNSSEKMIINSSGNVGIGTSSPTGFSGYTSLDINNATSGAIIDLSQGDVMKGRLVATASTMAIETASSVPILFQPEGTERMRISAGGDVGIGTTSTSSIQGLLHIHSSSNDNGDGDGEVNFGDESTVIISTNATVAGGQGYYGSLFFGGQDVSSATQQVWKLAGISAYSSADIGTTGSADLLFYTTSSSSTPTERMRIDSNGTVGVGVIPKTDWGDDGIQIGSKGTLSGGSSYTGYAFNAYPTSSGWAAKYTTTDEASLYLQGAAGLHLWYNAASGTAGTSVTWIERMRISANGNVGIGTTNPVSKLQVHGTVAVAPSNTAGDFLTIASGNYKTTIGGWSNGTDSDIDGLLPGSTFGNIMRGAPNGHFVVALQENDNGDSFSVVSGGGNYQTDTTYDTLAFTVDARGHAAFSGNLLVGTNSTHTGAEGGQISLYDNNATAGVFHIDVAGAFNRLFTTTNNQNFQIGQLGGTGGRLIFYTAGTRRMDIDSNGDVQIHGTSMLASSILSVDGSGEARNGVASKVNNNAYWNYVGINASGSNTFYVYGDGDVENTNNSYGAISDERLKSNIVDASSQIDDIMAVQVRSYTLNETGATHIGVVAQELEASGMSGLVKENEDGMKSVKYSVLYMKAIKALQEAVTRIETLEAEVAALKGE